MLKIGLNKNLERSGILKTKTLLLTSCINFVLSNDRQNVGLHVEEGYLKNSMRCMWLL
jgi:hypothetical protein